jgi:hypothetical protein
LVLSRGRAPLRLLSHFRGPAQPYRSTNWRVTPFPVPQVALFDGALNR